MPTVAVHHLPFGLPLSEHAVQELPECRLWPELAVVEPWLSPLAVLAPSSGFPLASALADAACLRSASDLSSPLGTGRVRTTLFVDTAAAVSMQALRALACVCSCPVHVDARKRSKGERPDAKDDDVRLTEFYHQQPNDPTSPRCSPAAPSMPPAFAACRSTPFKAFASPLFSRSCSRCSAWVTSSTPTRADSASSCSSKP